VEVELDVFAPALLRVEVLMIEIVSPMHVIRFRGFYFPVEYWFGRHFDYVWLIDD